MPHDEMPNLFPVPTVEQTFRFAEHVADNHGWYKHLPFFPPGASFVFFPNPHAGRGVRAEGERFVVYDIGVGEYFDHHNRLSTAEYVAQFGHWDYWVDDNPRASESLPGPWLYSANDGQRKLLPDNLKRLWSCRLTAFLRPAPPMFRLRAGELLREADAFMASEPSFGRHPPAPLSEQRDEDPATRWYRAIAREPRRAAGTEGNVALYDFMESEAQAQRGLVLNTLHRVRQEWSASTLDSRFSDPGEALTSPPPV
jgi:hypothetical protein